MYGIAPIYRTGPARRDLAAPTPAAAPPPREDGLWARVRDDYLAGMSGPEVCERYGVKASTLRYHAQKEGWRRLDQPEPDPPVVEEEEPEDENAEPAAAEDLAKRAWRRATKAVLDGKLQAARGWTRLASELRMLARLESEAVAHAEYERRQAAKEAEIAPRRAAYVQAAMARGVSELHAQAGFRLGLPLSLQGSALNPDPLHNQGARAPELDNLDGLDAVSSPTPAGENEPQAADLDDLDCLDALSSPTPAGEIGPEPARLDDLDCVEPVSSPSWSDLAAAYRAVYPAVFAPPEPGATDMVKEAEAAAPPVAEPEISYDERRRRWIECGYAPPPPPPGWVPTEG